MIKSPIRMYKNDNNWSIFMLRFSGIETSIVRRSTCVFSRHRVKTLLSKSGEEGNRQGMYMHASPWSKLPKNCYSCLSFGRFFFVEAEGPLPCSKGSNTVPVVSRINSFYTPYPISLSLFNIIISTLRRAKWYPEVFLWNFGCNS